MGRRGEGVPEFREKPGLPDEPKNAVADPWKGVGVRVRRRTPETGPELKEAGRVELAPDETAMRQRRIGGVFAALGGELVESGAITGSDVQLVGDDTHAFLTLTDRPNEVVHVHGHSGLSRDGYMTVTARLMDRRRMEKIRATALYNAVGSETGAVIYPELALPQTDMVYDPHALSLFIGTIAPKLVLPERR